MTVDDGLRDDLRAQLEGRDAIVEKAMFGGVGFMWRGNLLCGVMGSELLVRVAKEDAEALVGDDGAHPMVMGGRTSRGWMLVPMSLPDRSAILAKWVAIASAYVETLPPK
jgi:TfoX/Sxy family transcriptional regulator of competence genes